MDATKESIKDEKENRSERAASEDGLLWCVTL